MIQVRIIVVTILLSNTCIAGLYSAVRDGIHRMFLNQVCFLFTIDRQQSAENNLFYQVIKQLLVSLAPSCTGLAEKDQDLVGISGNEMELSQVGGLSDDESGDDNKLTGDSEGKLLSYPTIIIIITQALMSHR